MKQVFTAVAGFAAVLVVILGIFMGWKTVQVWSAAQSGKAILAEAEYSRQARVMEAEAKHAAAEKEGQAELIRAEYAAQANAKLSEGLGGPEGYLRFMYIRMLEEQGQNNSQVIYIPTEAGMPILEAGKRE